MRPNYSTDQENFTGHMFNIKLEEKPYKMSFKALPVKIQQLKNRQAGHNVSFPRGQIGLNRNNALCSP